MNRIRHFFRPLVIGYVILLGGLSYAIIGLEHTTERLTTVQINSTDSRIVTVAQRCELTSLVLDGARRIHSPDVRKLEHNLAACQKQLVMIKKVAEGSSAHRTKP